MSNISKVIAYVQAEPNFDKVKMVEKIMTDLNVTKSNAQVYLYNALKKIGSGAPVKTRKAKAEKPAKIERVSKTSRTEEDIARIKEERLQMMKEVGQRIKKYEPPVHDEVTQKYLDEADEYARTQGPDAFLRHLGVR